MHIVLDCRMKLYNIVAIVSLFFIISITDILGDPNPDAQANAEAFSGFVADAPLAEIANNPFTSIKSQKTRQASYRKPEKIISPDGSTKITVYNADNTIMETFYYADNTTIVQTLSPDKQLLSQKIFDAKNNLTRSEKLNADNTRSITIYKADGTKSVVLLSADKKPISATNINMTNKITNSTLWNPDKTTTRTDIYSDGSQLISVSDAQANTLSRTFINANGKKTSMDGKLAIAMHEAAHGVSYINNRSIANIHEIGIEADTTIKDLGNNISLGEGMHLAGVNYTHPTYLVQKNILELKNNIITLLAGGVADQIAVNQDMLTNPKDIFQFFDHPSYSGDLPSARQAAQEIIKKNSPNLSAAEIQKQVDDMIVSSYKKTYQFVTEKKSDVEKLANALVEKKIMSSHAVYNLLEANKPLYEFEQGPLPISLIEDYKLRGWAKNTTERTPLYDKNTMAKAIDLRRDIISQVEHGNKVETKYYVNGNKALEIHTTPDGTKIQIQYKNDGSLENVFIAGESAPRTLNQITSDSFRNSLSKNINVYTSSMMSNSSTISTITTDKKGNLISIKKTEYNGSYEKRDGNGILTSSLKVTPNGRKTETEYHSDGSQSIKTFDKKGAIIDQYTIATPKKSPSSLIHTTPTPEKQAQIINTNQPAPEPALIIDQPIAKKPMALTSRASDNHKMTTKPLPAAQKALEKVPNQIIANLHNQKSQARQPQPHEQRAEIKGL